ncbi:MAG: site-specific DNA-methyltransferase [Lachnospiraceae bacterium]|nr:site-specific DNA-methyltransferase [Lachnospiraceae bacterium]
MQKKGKLELTWVGKYDVPELEPRILIEDESKSYGANDTGCMLIHGDNLLALKALEAEYVGKVKCIYIDPPYNTGSAFEQYDDNLEHSQWLNLLYPRLKIMHNLLSEKGSIWISIDADECAYLKIICDEVFGRENYRTMISWQRKYSVSNNFKGIATISEYILVYSKSEKFVANLLPRTEESINRYGNPDNDSRGPWKAVDYLNQATVKQRPNLCYEIVNPNTKEIIKNDVKAWKYELATHQKHVEEDRLWWGIDGKNSVPALKLFLSEVRQGMTPHNWWPYDEVGHTDEAKKESIALFGKENVFATPKPERLIERVITLSTNPGDIVLDSFLGSGTTIAVAHKMNRKWIGIELGNHAYTYCKRRIDKVIAGQDLGGITKTVGWIGGGGYRFYELAEPLLVKNSKLPIYQINPSYTYDMIAEAICKIEGFTYAPQGEFHGHSSENRFIHITMEFVNTKYIQSMMKNLGERQSLLIYCKRMQSDMNLPVNVEVRRIPKDLLNKCSFEEVQDENG